MTSKQTLRYVIKRITVVDYRGPYHAFQLVDTQTNTVIAGANSKSPVAPQWLRDKQGLLNTREYLDR